MESVLMENMDVSKVFGILIQELNFGFKTFNEGCWRKHVQTVMASLPMLTMN